MFKRQAESTSIRFLLAAFLYKIRRKKNKELKYSHTVSIISCIIAKTKCTIFQNEMCIFCHFCGLLTDYSNSI